MRSMDGNIIWTLALISHDAFELQKRLASQLKILKKSDDLSNNKTASNLLLFTRGYISSKLKDFSQ